MNLVITELEEAPTRAFIPAFTAVVVNDATVVFDGSFDTESARRDAVVTLLLANYDEVAAEDVAEILEPFGGASADTALAEVIALYVDCGVDVYLNEHLRDIGPAVLYSAFTDYGDGTTLIEHYGSRNDRLTDLRQRAANLSEGYPAEFFDNADEETCKKIIDSTLWPTHGRVLLLEADRADVGETYSGYAPRA